MLNAIKFRLYTLSCLKFLAKALVLALNALVLALGVFSCADRLGVLELGGRLLENCRFLAAAIRMVSLCSFFFKSTTDESLSKKSRICVQETARMDTKFNNTIIAQTVADGGPTRENKV
mmetsp:Transcript_20947/g.41523  ORF Transcript_20947/g.41523 Transcript_20947/m.41523 type:complete len:119 (-) Transcript_20947:364-720(-)